MTNQTAYDQAKAITDLYVAAIGYRGKSSGEVYALVMGLGVTLDNHLAVLRGLTSAGVLTETSAHWLTLTGLGNEMFARLSARETANA